MRVLKLRYFNWLFSKIRMLLEMTENIQLNYLQNLLLIHNNFL